MIRVSSHLAHERGLARLMCVGPMPVTSSAQRRRWLVLAAKEICLARRALLSAGGLGECGWGLLGMASVHLSNADRYRRNASSTLRAVRGS